MKKLLLVLLILIGVPVAIMFSQPDPIKPHAQSAESRAMQSHDYSAMKGGFKKTVAIMWRFMFDKPVNTEPAEPVPVRPLTRADLLAAPDNTLYRLGHSTVLLKLHNAFWITDPVFAERASFVQWAGPKRFHQPPISVDELPPIKAVILSHDHYDHLDQAAILKLADKTEHFISPLGVGDRLIAWGVDPTKVQQLDWWQETTIAGLRFVATPAQHFSGRGLRDKNRTLWCSWAIIDKDQRLFFSGDSGYFDGFKRIGERLGPFDLTLIENGAYNVDWPGVHMRPEETLQAHLDLKGRTLVPIHNGTFDLAMHAWYEPFERILALTSARQVALSTPMMGEALSIRDPQRGKHWWRSVRTLKTHEPADSAAAAKPIVSNP